MSVGVFLRCSSITQLAVRSVSPARHIAVVEDGAGVGISGRDRHGRATRAKAAREGGSVFVRCSTIAQLAVVSVSPARHRTVVKDGAGMTISRRDRHGCATRTKAARERGRVFVEMFLHYPIGRRIHLPSTTHHRCQGWRRCGYPPEESATAVRPVPRLLVSVGVDLSDVPPLPNWP